MGIKEWFKTKLEGGVKLYEGETDNGQSCSFKIRSLGAKTREIFDKVGTAECIEELKKKARRAED